MNDKYSKWMFIIFPAITMLLGWGLRGHIGGGPFGAMIPGAMVALSITILLKLPSNYAAIIVVFGVAGIGLGGEMTYGQTLSFLREPETTWWGIIATTVKGSVWGLLGAIVLSMGFVYNRLERKTIVVAFVLLMLGMLMGFKLINQPMVIYFSDPSNPRPESWGALLLGAVFLLTYLKYKTTKQVFKVISRFSIYGLIGGGLGFGIGGLWFVLGSALPKEVIFNSWWKSMEFTFGFLLGSSLGYAAWISRKELKLIAMEKSLASRKLNIYGEIALSFFVGLLIYWIIPQSLEPFVDSVSVNDGVLLNGLRDIAMILINYSFYGFILVVVVMYFPELAWQIGITLTFCHAVIDLIRDNFMEILGDNSLLAPFWMISITLIIAFVTAYLQRGNNIKRSMFLLLVWSTMIISYLAFLVTGRWNSSNLTIGEILFRQYFVDLIFTFSAVYVTWIAVSRLEQNNDQLIN